MVQLVNTKRSEDRWRRIQWNTCITLRQCTYKYLYYLHFSKRIFWNSKYKAMLNVNSIVHCHTKYVVLLYMQWKFKTIQELLMSDADLRNQCVTNSIYWTDVNIITIEIVLTTKRTCFYLPKDIKDVSIKVIIRLRLE